MKHRHFHGGHRPAWPGRRSRYPFSRGAAILAAVAAGSSCRHAPEPRPAGEVGARRQAGVQQAAPSARLLSEGEDFVILWYADGAVERYPIDRGMLVPSDESAYVSFSGYEERVAVFPIGNGQFGLRLSSYDLQREGSAQTAAGRDLVLILDPESRAVRRGLVDLGVTHWRSRAAGCWHAEMSHFLLADIDGDGLIDIGRVREDLYCIEAQRPDVDAWIGPFYRQHEWSWYVYRMRGWRESSDHRGRLVETYTELPPPAESGPVDYVALRLWGTYDPRRWRRQPSVPLPLFVPEYRRRLMGRDPSRR